MASKICIQELAELIGGKLKFGSMPPLGGEFEPVRRLMPTGSELHKGDVVVSPIEQGFDGTTEVAECANQAYSQGAFGVVTTQNICPWEGRFSLQVPDVEAAIWAYLCQVNSTVAVTTIAVLDDRAKSPVVEKLKRSGLKCDSNLPLAWQCLQWQSGTTDHAPVLLHVREDNWPSEETWPNALTTIAVVTDHANEDLLPRIQSEEMIGTTVLLSGVPECQLVTETLRLLKNGAQQGIA